MSDVPDIMRCRRGLSQIGALWFLVRLRSGNRIQRLVDTFCDSRDIFIRPIVFNVMTEEYIRNAPLSC